MPAPSPAPGGNYTASSPAVRRTAAGTLPHACHGRVFHQRSRRALLSLKTNRRPHTQPAPFPLAYDPAPYRNRPEIRHFRSPIPDSFSPGVSGITMPFPPPLHKAQVSANPPVIVVDSQAKNSPRCLRWLNARPVVRTAFSAFNGPFRYASLCPGPPGCRDCSHAATRITVDAEPSARMPAPSLSCRCPASTIFAGWRQLVLPVHLLGLDALLGSVAVRPSYMCKSEPQIQEEVIFTMPSLGCCSSGSGIFSAAILNGAW